MSGRDRSGRADHPLPGGNRIPSDEIEELASRAGGPGGQHVNKTNTRVSLRWDLRGSRGLSAAARVQLLDRLRSRLSREGVLVVHADRNRSRERNREAAHARLRELVEQALRRDAPRQSTRPPRGSVQRRLDAKRQRSAVKRQRRRRSDED